MPLTHVSSSLPILSQKAPFVNKSFEKLLNACKDLSCTLHSHPINHERSYVVHKIKSLNQVILRFCKDSTSLNDIVTVYRSLSHICLGYYPNFLDNSQQSPKGSEIFQFFDKNYFKFTLFSIEDQCVKSVKFLNPHQILYLLFSHFKNGRQNHVFVQTLLSSFISQNLRGLPPNFRVYTPKVISLLARALYRSKGYDLNLLALDKLIDLVISQSIEKAREFTLLDTVLLTDSLLKFGYDYLKVGDILLRILTRNVFELPQMKEVLSSFTDLYQYSILVDIFAQCYPIDFSAKDKSKMDMWLIMIDQYIDLLKARDPSGLPKALKALLKCFKVSDEHLMKLSKIEHGEVDMPVDYLLYNRIISLLNMCRDVVTEARSASKNFFDVSELFAVTLFGISRLRLDKFEYLSCIGDYLMENDLLRGLTTSLIASICYYYAECNYYHPFIPLALSRFVCEVPDVSDFNRVIYTLGKFGIYSTSFMRHVVDICTTGYLDKLSASGLEGLVYLFYYIMAHGFYRELIGFNLTHHLAIKIGHMIGECSDARLIGLYKISSLLYKIIPTDNMDEWANREGIDQVSAKWVRSNLVNLQANSSVVGNSHI